ncbi:DDE transposase [Hypericibacter adhaerens]|jgi:transposase-like protein|uniref:DDE transposase n=1 Tax=Hypericibacter adhaerens TaxID=2602016 RepID=A0A5J6N388_9PROT|nr:IS1595 family transposase [Hypericibacter adhaerens]QEX23794.1 DDE transposase [Hypericibacter adhaerens]
MTDLTLPIYNDDDAARAHLEAIRWPDGAFCPHCGELDNVHRMEGTSHAPGLHYCRSCRKKFSVTVGTVFERSHIPLHKWVLASHLMSASKKGISAHQLHRMLGITYKSAWFMAHRLREAMRETKPGPLGGEGKTVESDETYIGGKEKNKHRSKRNASNIGGMGKEIVLSLVEREGRVRSHHIPEVNAKTLRPILVAQIDRKSFLMTDEAGQYYHPGKEFAKHETVNHGAGEYVRGDAHSNTVENYFSILKRGITGTYHHVSQQHLKRYLAEFDFRYNERSGLGIEDDERAMKALKGIEGKRLTYRRAD